MSISINLQGKTVLVTGGATGIGKAIVYKLAAAGSNIVFTYLNTNQIEVQNIEQELCQLGTKVMAIRADLSDYNVAGNVIEDVVSAFGTLDVLVNNAGITRDNLLLRMTALDWDLVLSVNLKSIFSMVKSSVKVFLKQRSGSIINISSVVGIKGNPGQANYAASKAGIIGFTKSVALELGSRNIRANVIAPGFIRSAMTAGLAGPELEAWVKNIPLKRIGLPEDVANCALFLASDASSYITGQVIQVDGGMLT